MFSRFILSGLSVLALLAAENSWDKVRDLKTGCEVRIFKKGSHQPVLAILDQADNEKLIVVVKNQEIAIDRDDVDRVDFRPPTAKKSRVTKETHTTQSDTTQTTPVGPTAQGERGGPTTSTSTTASFGSGSKPDFETVYRRTVK